MLHFLSKRNKSVSLSLTCVALIASLGISQNAQAQSCEALNNYQGFNVNIQATAIRPDPIWESPRSVVGGGRPLEVTEDFCRVEGVIETEIKFELWLPMLDNWNGRFLGIGNGGDAGFINYADLTRGVNRGFASASTDTGHVMGNPRWGDGRPDRVENYAHRAHHLLPLVAKDITETFYGSHPDYSYFMGCSGGGSQGIIEAQFYPYDYDGILAGAHGVGMTPISVRILDTALFQRDNPEYFLTPDQWNYVYENVQAQCDADDGVTDGIVSHPAVCNFNPQPLQCSAANSHPQCLSGEQLQAVNKAYSPLLDDIGRQLDPGWLPGSKFQPVPRQIGIAGAQFGDWIYEDPNWDVDSFNFTNDMPLVQEKLPALYYPDPDLRAFKNFGGKLITYHGLVDYIVPPGLGMQVYNSTVKRIGPEQTDDFYRFFLAPGMDHCGGGNGPNVFGQANRGDPPIVDAEHDILSALVHWVEEGEAPDQIIATGTSAEGETMTRPLCPYPLEAVYKGRGDTNRAENFSCQAAE